MSLTINWAKINRRRFLIPRGATEVVWNNFFVFLACGVMLMGASAALGEEHPNAIRMEDATAWVTEEARSIEEFASQLHLDWPAGFGWTLASIEYSMSRLSSLQHKARLHAGVLPKGGLNHADSLERGLGLCGNYVQLASDLIWKSPTRLPHRSVQFYIHNEEQSKNYSHVTIEVFYGGSWHLFDPHYGVAPLAPGPFHPSKILSATEALKAAESGIELPHLDLGRCAMRLLSEAQGHPPFDYLRWETKDVLFGAKGTINLAVSADGSELSLQNMPNYVGQAADYEGSIGSIKFEYDNNGAAPVRSLRLFVEGVGGSIGECELSISVSGKGVFRAVLDKISRDEPIEVPLTRHDKVTLEVLSSTGKQGYIVWKRIAVDGKKECKQ